MGTPSEADFCIAAKDIISRTNQDNTVILMRCDEVNVFFKIDGIAASVWGDLYTGASSSTLMEKYCQQYPNFQNELRRDIPAFIDHLASKNLIVRK